MTRARPVPPIVTDLVNVRRRADLTQQQVATSMGTEQSSLSQYEVGRKSPNLATLVRWAAALGFEVRLVPQVLR